MPAFPSHLAKVVVDRWHSMVAGEYEPPPCPPLKLLKQLLEVCYLTASAPEEGRYPQFNIAAVPEGHIDNAGILGTRWQFTPARLLSVAELRRLAPAVNFRKSAVWVAWSESEWRISGLVDLGTSWHRARAALGYRYRHPGSLLVQIDRPGRLRVYQGAYQVATLVDGVIEGHKGIGLNLFLHDPANKGLRRMNEAIITPEYELPRDFESFEFIALWNTYAAIANAISSSAHGGMLIVIPGDRKVDPTLIKLKYQSDSNVLFDAFVKFINSRHVLGDYTELLEDGHGVPEGEVYKAELVSRDTYDLLVEATRFVAGLSGCDGSIVIADDLRLLGFGGEIRAELLPGAKVYDVREEMDRSHPTCDIEQFGMRHRSAIKLASQDHDCRILAISQDGPISGIWWDKEGVLVKRGVNLVNLNLPWA